LSEAWANTIPNTTHQAAHTLWYLLKKSKSPLFQYQITGLRFYGATSGEASKGETDTEAKAARRSFSEAWANTLTYCDLSKPYYTLASR